MTKFLVNALFLSSEEKPPQTTYRDIPMCPYDGINAHPQNLHAQTLKTHVKFNLLAHHILCQWYFPNFADKVRIYASIHWYRSTNVGI